MAGSQTPAESQFWPPPVLPAAADCRSFDPDTALTSRLKPGDLVSDRYRIQSLIGQGGMGVVYKVEQIFLGKELALKVLNTSSLSDVTMRRFQHEARAAFGIDHPNLIAVHDFGLLDEKVPFLVMDYIQGESLSDRIRSKGTLTLEQAVPMFIRICFGLGYAHQQGVVHRDIKPSNIMIVDDMPAATDGSVKIVDFGIAKFTQLEKGDIQALTRTGEVFGSPLYMSPEQCTGSPVDERSDIYSLGCVFFEALTGTTPFVGANALSTMMLHMGEPPPTMKEASMGKEFAPLLEQIIAKMLAKKAGDRYQSLAQVAGDLAVLERTLADPQLLARTVLIDEKPKMPRPDAQAVKIARSRLYLIMVGLMAVSAAFSSLLTISLSPVSEERKGFLERNKSAHEEKLMHTDDVRRFLKTLETRNGRLQVSDSAFLNALKRRNQDGAINLRFLNLNDFAMSALAQARWIEDLDLLGSSVENDRLIDLARLPNLAHITMSHSNLDDVGASGIARCPGLVKVEANWTNITDKAIPYFTAMPSLRRLEISGAALRPLSIRFLAEKPQLEALILRGVTGLDDRSFAPLVGSNLQFLNVEDVQIGDTATVYISQMRHLRSIALGLTKITARGVEKLLTNKSLVTIMYAPSDVLKDSDIQKLSRKYPHCRFLNRLQKGDGQE